MTTTATVVRLPVLLPGLVSDPVEVGLVCVTPAETGVAGSGWVTAREGSAGDVAVSAAWLAVGGTAED